MKIIALVIALCASVLLFLLAGKQDLGVQLALSSPHARIHPIMFDITSDLGRNLRELEMTEACGKTIDDFINSDVNLKAAFEFYWANLASWIMTASLKANITCRVPNIGPHPFVCLWDITIIGEDAYRGACATAGGEMVNANVDHVCSPIGADWKSISYDLPAIMTCIRSDLSSASCVASLVQYIKSYILYIQQKDMNWNCAMSDTDSDVTWSNGVTGSFGVFGSTAVGLTIANVTGSAFTNAGSVISPASGVPVTGSDFTNAGSVISPASGVPGPTKVTTDSPPTSVNDESKNMENGNKIAMGEKIEGAKKEADSQAKVSRQENGKKKQNGIKKRTKKKTPHFNTA